MATLFNSGALCSLYQCILGYIPLSRMFFCLLLFSGMAISIHLLSFNSNDYLIQSLLCPYLLSQKLMSGKKVGWYHLLLWSFFQEVLKECLLCVKRYAKQLMSQRINHNVIIHLLLLRTNNCKTVWVVYSGNIQYCCLNNAMLIYILVFFHMFFHLSGIPWNFAKLSGKSSFISS